MPEIEFQPFYVDETASWLFSTVLDMFSLVGLNKKRWVLICIKPYLMQIRFPDIQLFSFRLVKTIFYFQNQLFRLSFGFLFRFICVSFQLCLLAASSISFMFIKQVYYCTNFIFGPVLFNEKHKKSFHRTYNFRKNNDFNSIAVPGPCTRFTHRIIRWVARTTKELPVLPV